VKGGSLNNDRRVFSVWLKPEGQPLTYDFSMITGEIEDPFEAVKWQQVLGGEGFLRKLKDQWNQRVESRRNCGVIPHAQQQFGGSDDSANQDPRRSNSEGIKASNKS
jgi:hypothetical protein